MGTGLASKHSWIKRSTFTFTFPFPFVVLTRPHSVHQAMSTFKVLVAFCWCCAHAIDRGQRSRLIRSEERLEGDADALESSQERDCGGPCPTSAADTGAAAAAPKAKAKAKAKVEELKKQAKGQKKKADKEVKEEVEQEMKKAAS